MKKNLVIVEGIEDKKFIESLLTQPQQNLENKFVVEQITTRGGKTEFKSDSIKSLLIEFAKKDPNQSLPKNVLLICDADFKEIKEPICGFDKTLKFMNDLVKDESLREKYPDINFNLFILPDNKNDGNLDSLFLQCATKKITEKSSCVDDYLKCLGVKLSINKKDKLRSQLLISAIGIQKGFTKVGDVVDKKHDYWNLDHKSLEPLKKFLKKFK